MAISRRQLFERLGLGLGALGLGSIARAVPQAQNLGYSDTPIIPGTQWRVHDGMRPQPRVVTPGASTGWAPPSDAIVLFDGTNLDAWRHGNGAARWLVEDGAFVVVPGTGPMRTRADFGDVQLHLEFSPPTPPRGMGQGRGNSGLFFHDRYELQILDSFKSQTYPDGMVGALYGQFPPLVNAARPPGEWSFYDVVWKNPRWEGSKLVRPASMTVFLNGVLLHHDQPLMGATLHRQVGTFEPHPPEGPISLQDHGNPTRFRNVWVRPLRGYDQP